MDPTRGVTFVMDDPRWIKKILIGGLLTSFPVIEAFSDGYQIQTLRNLMDRQPRPLPEWDNYEAYFRRGISLRLAIYAVYIPVILVDTLAVLLVLARMGSWLIDKPEDRQTTLQFLFGMRLALPVVGVIAFVLTSVVLLTVPLMVRRAVDGASFFKLLNPIPSVRLGLRYTAPYLLGRVSIIVLLAFTSVVASVLGTAGLAVVVGPIAGWYLLGIGRFWGRLTWAWHLAQMVPGGLVQSQAGSGQPASLIPPPLPQFVSVADVPPPRVTAPGAYTPPPVPSPSDYRRPL